MGIEKGSRLYDLHQEYYRAIAAMGALLIATPDTENWSEVQAAQEAFLRAIFEEYRSRKGG